MSKKIEKYAGKFIFNIVLFKDNCLFSTIVSTFGLLYNIFIGLNEVFSGDDYIIIDVQFIIHFLESFTFAVFEKKIRENRESSILVCIKYFRKCGIKKSFI